MRLGIFFMKGHCVYRKYIRYTHYFPAKNSDVNSQYALRAFVHLIRTIPMIGTIDMGYEIFKILCSLRKESLGTYP